MKEKEPFNDDMIRRDCWHTLGPIPKDAFELIHDLAYHVESRDVDSYAKRAQAILRYSNARKA